MQRTERDDLLKELAESKGDSLLSIRQKEFIKNGVKFLMFSTEKPSGGRFALVIKQEEFDKLSDAKKKKLLEPK